MFTKFHNYRFMNDRFAYITRTIRFANTQWFSMMTNTLQYEHFNCVHYKNL